MTTAKAAAMEDKKSWDDNLLEEILMRVRKRILPEIRLKEEAKVKKHAPKGRSSVADTIRALIGEVGTRESGRSWRPVNFYYQSLRGGHDKDDGLGAKERVDGVEGHESENDDAENEESEGEERESERARILMERILRDRRKQTQKTRVERYDAVD